MIEQVRDKETEGKKDKKERGKDRGRVGEREEKHGKG